VVSETGHYNLSLKRIWIEELTGQIWVRTWSGQGENTPDWFPRALSAARPALGYGVIDPLELRIDGPAMTLVCPGEGSTLARYLSKSFQPAAESYTRFLGEQICIALWRIHQGLKTVHGALTPFNLQMTDDYTLKIWSLHTARLELSWDKLERQWEVPYRSPQVREGRTPTIADDIYSVGMIFARILLGTADSFQFWLNDRSQVPDVSPQAMEIVNRCTNPERDRRYNSVREIALDLNSDTLLKELDTEGATEDCRLGEQAFLKEQFPVALEHFRDGVNKDGLSMATHNNLAVTEALLTDWGRAEDTLKKAYQLCPHHPILDANWALTLWENEGSATARYWLEKAVRLNPAFVQPLRVLSRIFRDSGALEKATECAGRCLLLNPRCPESRRLMAGLLESLGATREAESHRHYAGQLSGGPSLSDHLITAETPPPWTLSLNKESETVLNRVNIIENLEDLRRCGRS